MTELLRALCVNGTHEFRPSLSIATLETASRRRHLKFRDEEGAVSISTALRPTQGDEKSIQRNGYSSRGAPASHPSRLRGPEGRPARRQPSPEGLGRQRKHPRAPEVRHRLACAPQPASSDLPATGSPHGSFTRTDFVRGLIANACARTEDSRGSHFSIEAAGLSKHRIEDSESAGVTDVDAVKNARGR
jgi:hypothetical protein